MSENKFNWIAVGTLGFTLVAATAIGFTMGFYLDKWLNTDPWFTLIMLFLGIIAGIKAVYEDIRKLKNK